MAFPRFGCTPGFRCATRPLPRLCLMQETGCAYAQSRCDSAPPNSAALWCRRVALYAVDSLRQLVAKLLARAELEHFTHQEEALRPFVAVLRQCDEACVRELAVQCVMQVRSCDLSERVSE